MFPLDIWRHMLAFQDPELSYRISILSKRLYALSRLYRRSPCSITAYQINLLEAVDYSDVASNAMRSTWDTYIASLTWLFLPSNRENSSINFIRSGRQIQFSSQDGRYVREFSRNEFLGVCSLTVKSVIKTWVYLPICDFIFFESYEFFDRRYTAHSRRVSYVDRYSIVLFPDHDSYPSQNTSIYRQWIADFLDQYRTVSNCEVRWYSKERELHLTFNLGQYEVIN